MNIPSGVSFSRMDAIDVWTLKQVMNTTAQQSSDIVNSTLQKTAEAQAHLDPNRGHTIDIRV